MNSESIIAEYNRVKILLGHPPSMGEFFKNSSVSPTQLQKAFGRKPYARLVETVGDQPNPFSKEAYPVEQLLTIWGGWVRKLGYLPGRPDWQHHKITPSETVFRRNFGVLSSIPKHFFARFGADPEWIDIVPIIQASSQANSEAAPTTGPQGPIASPENLSIPALQLLGEYSTREGKSLEFENLIAPALQVLGFAVKSLGQGTGRNPDGLAFSSKFHIGFMYDAKARHDRYAFGTDDRVFNEYISSHRKFFSQRGIQDPFFLVVSSAFAKISQESLERVQLPLFLLKAEQLSRLVEIRIRYSAFFEPDDLHHFLVKENGRGIVNDKKFAAFVEQIQGAYEREIL